MNTHEQFIAPETARLAKQAGFDWETNTVYKEEKLITDVTNFNWNMPKEDFEKEGSDNLFSAPTQAVLQRWLREVKNMRLTVLPWIGRNDKTEWSYITGRFYDQIKLSRAIGNEYSFDTYEAALEAGLQKCLTLIIEKQ